MLTLGCAPLLKSLYARTARTASMIIVPITIPAIAPPGMTFTLFEVLGTSLPSLVTGDVGEGKPIYVGEVLLGVVSEGFCGAVMVTYEDFSWRPRSI